jgi:hypothetical protein
MTVIEARVLRARHGAGTAVRRAQFAGAAGGDVYSFEDEPADGGGGAKAQIVLTAVVVLAAVLALVLAVVARQAISRR